VEFPKGPVNIIRSRLGRQKHESPTTASVFCLVGIGDHAKLLGHFNIGVDHQKRGFHARIGGIATINVKRGLGRSTRQGKEGRLGRGGLRAGERTTSHGRNQLCRPPDDHRQVLN